MSSSRRFIACFSVLAVTVWYEGTSSPVIGSLWLSVTCHLSESPRRFRPLLVYFLGSSNLTFSTIFWAERPGYILDYISDYKLTTIGFETRLTAVIAEEQPDGRG